MQLPGNFSFSFASFLALLGCLRVWLKFLLPLSLSLSSFLTLPLSFSHSPVSLISRNQRTTLVVQPFCTFDEKILWLIMSGWLCTHTHTRTHRHTVAHQTIPIQSLTEKDLNRVTSFASYFAACLSMKLQFVKFQTFLRLVALCVRVYRCRVCICVYVCACACGLEWHACRLTTDCL